MTAKTIIARAADRLGIAHLTPMQSAMTKVSLPARLLLLSPTGSGKTLAFTLAFLRALRPEADGVKGLVLAPTRELALQVYETVRAVAAPEMKTAVLYGGHPMETEVNSLGGSPDIIVATPGRLLDHIKRGHLSLYSVQALVLDEYDKSLELGFLAEMKAIAGRLRALSTLILTSATKLAELPDFLGKGDIEIFDYAAADSETVVPDICFRRVDSPSADKLETLDALLHDLSGRRVMIFVNHRDAAQRVFEHLHKRGFPIGLYHGGLEQDGRERALTLFANGTTPMLVSTDLAARGLDISGVDAVVHYHLPSSPEALTHRNGRTARMGRSGEAYAIISDSDKLPDFFPALDAYWPEGKGSVKPSEVATLFFNAGKKEKISRGDIAGFLIHKGGLRSDEVGRIDLADHHAYVAVPAAKARETVLAVAPHKIKNTRVRVTQLKM
ncbi:MAG: DEAD/DEAH box helicase [Muribaculaceae bacterium]|nr:DEAD/DEAH box helicase [Muribaculaceae bacterium]